MTIFDFILPFTLGVVIVGGLYLIISVWKDSALQKRRILKDQQHIKQLHQDKKNQIISKIY